MPDSSVDAYINAQPESAITLDEYWKSVGNNENIDSPGNKFLNFWTGMTSKARREYETYLSNLKNKNEFIASQSARAWDKMLDDTKYQRMMKDFEKAGLNPYLLINNNGISASSAPSSSKASYDRHTIEQKKSNDKTGSNIAMAVLAMIKIAAMLL